MSQVISMNQCGVPELTPEIEKMAKEALIRQFEDQYGVKIIVKKNNMPEAEPDGVQAQTI